MELSEKIKTLRTRNHLTQAQLADLIGVSRQAEAKWESGASAPDITKVPDLAKALGTTSDELLSPNPIKEGEEAKEPTGLLSEAITLEVARDEIEGVKALMGVLGYTSTIPEEKGSLILLDPVHYFASADRSLVHLGFGLEAAELVNHQKEALRAALIIGEKPANAVKEVEAAEAKFNSKRHLTRGILYLAASPFALAALIFCLWYALHNGGNLVILYTCIFLALLMAAFIVLFLVQGIAWVRHPSLERFRQENPQYQKALDELLSYAAKNQSLAEAAKSLPTKEAPEAKASDSTAFLDAIKKAQDLHDAGAISDAEFAQIKAKILNGDKN
jgi:transcriptional regulator with XRE-family HTH domain